MRAVPTDSQDSLILLRAACRGQGEALGLLLEKLRPWLRVVAQSMMGSDVAARVDASDVVQQTCLSVHRQIQLQQFVVEDVPQFMAWVRQIHHCNIRDELRRHVTAEERTVRCEVRSETLQIELAAQDSAGRALRLGEEALRLAAAIEQLPPAQRTAVTLRFLEDLPVSDIARQLNISADAVTSLLRRGVQALRTRLGPEDNSESENVFRNAANA